MVTYQVFKPKYEIFSSYSLRYSQLHELPQTSRGGAVKSSHFHSRSLNGFFGKLFRLLRYGDKSTTTTATTTTNTTRTTTTTTTTTTIFLLFLYRVKMKGSEKIKKYLDLAREIKNKKKNTKTG